MALSHEQVGSKISEKIKIQAIYSAEPNYFVHFAMRYPVLHMYKFFYSPEFLDSGFVILIIIAKRNDKLKTEH